MARKSIPLFLVALLVVLLVALAAGCAGGDKPQQQADPQQKDLILATTTSTQDTGLLDVLVPMFEEKTGYKVKTVAVGTGLALEMGTKGDADVLLVHAPDAELPLVESGVAVNRELVMHNDFVLLGPPADPAQVKGNANITEVFKKIADQEALFISRGDDSGTHKMELGIWTKAGIDPVGQKWYQETGQGMGASITMANEQLGYILSDRGTFLAQAANIDLDIVSEGDDVLKNIYHVMQVNPEKFPKVNGPGGQAFVEFMIDPEVQQVIKDFGVDKYGKPLFFADRLEG